MKKIAIILLLAISSTGWTQAVENPLTKRLAKLRGHLEKIKASPAALNLAKQALKEQRADLADQALAKAFPAFDRSLKLLAQGLPTGPTELATLAAAAPDPYVQLHARYHLGRFMLDSENPEGAVVAFNDFFAGKSKLSPHEAEAAFFLGIALSRIPSREEAINVFDNFLKTYPWAPNRYRAVAFQVLEELKRPGDNPLHGVADKMKAVTRKLKQGKPGKKTVDQEKEILNELDKLIEEMEKQENKNKGKGKGSPGNRNSSRPKQDGQTSKGKPKIGELNQAARKLAARWTALPKNERDKILQDLKKRFPPRYRQLLSAYFKKLSKKK